VIFAFAVLLYAVPSPVVAVVGVLAVVAVARRYTSFRCPRCNDQFLSVPDPAGWRQWPLRDTCQRYGLPVDADPPA